MELFLLLRIVIISSIAQLLLSIVADGPRRGRVTWQHVGTSARQDRAGPLPAGLQPRPAHCPAHHARTGAGRRVRGFGSCRRRDATGVQPLHAARDRARRQRGK